MPQHTDEIGQNVSPIRIVYRQGLRLESNLYLASIYASPDMTRDAFRVTLLDINNGQVCRS